MAALLSDHVAMYLAIATMHGRISYSCTETTSDNSYCVPSQSPYLAKTLRI